MNYPSWDSRVDQAEIRFLIEKNADGIVVLDEDGVVLFANPATEHIFGRTPSSLVGSPLGILLVSGETTEITVHRPGGSRTDVEIRAVETKWGAHNAILASIRDVSARKTMEERIRHSTKMEAIGRLTAGIAHDFNNLLTVVLGNLELAQRQPEKTSLQTALSNATHGARRAARLTERLLAFARKKPLEPRPVNVNELVSRMSDLLRRTLGESISIGSVLGPNLWSAKIDPTELEAAIINLAVNGRDAAASKVVIETSNVEIDEVAAAAEKEFACGPYVRVSVADTGTGMTPEVMEKVFEPFFTTKPDGRGTGLGLSQVYGFAKQSGGHVKLMSEVGRGTTVELYLPKSDLPEIVSVAHDSVGHAGPVPTGRTDEIILVVEDDADVRRYTATTLRELGYSVLEAADGPSAIEIVRHEHVRLLFTDLGLPGGMNGLAVAARARQVREDLKVLVTTAYAGEALVHDGRLDPGVDLLTKPFTYADLATRIRKHLAGKDRQSVSGRPRILLVEDEPLLRMFLVQALEEGGYRCDEAASFGQAVRKISRNAFAAAVVDVGLPDRPGYGLVAELRARQPDIPIVLASGFVDHELGGRFESDDRVRLVSKPFEATALISILRDHGVWGANSSTLPD